jgi:hypothetical protein
MTPDQLQSLKADYLEWTGGFEPEVEEDIETYVEAAMAVDLDVGEVREALRRWMREALASDNGAPA